MQRRTTFLLKRRGTGALSTTSSRAALIFEMASMTRASGEEQGSFARTVVVVRLLPFHDAPATTLAVSRRD